MRCGNYYPKSRKIHSCYSLQQNLHLAEILLKSWLSEISNNQDSDTKLIKTAIALSKNVVVKYQYDWNLAWQFATNLATKPIFQDKTECFDLLDTVLQSEIPTQNLYNFFKHKFANLLPHVESIKIQQSNLYRQLLHQNANAGELLNELITKRNETLDILPNLSNLVGMNDSQQDKFCYEFLKIWSPSYAEARKLLVALIELNNFNCNQTFNWFENNKPGIVESIYNLQKSPNWNNWDKLARILYDTEQESLVFIDKLVGRNFPVDTVQKYLPIIASDENLRSNFCKTSCAWKVIQHQDLNNLAIKLPEYAVTLVRCLQESQRFDWINGDLLHCLCQHWISQNYIEPQLQTLVTSPSVTKGLKNQDWLKMQMLAWEPGIKLKLPVVKAFLQDNDKINLSSNALKVLEKYTQFEQRQNVLYDCWSWNLDSTELKNIAIKVVQLCTQPEEMQKLLENCKNSGLSIEQQKEIIKAAPMEALTIDLILKYLGYDGQKINLEKELELVQILLQIKQYNNTEISNLRKISVDFLTKLVSQNNIVRIKWWKETACNKEIYYQAFQLAIKDFMRQTNFESIKAYSQNLKDYSLFEENKLIAKVFSEFGLELS